MQQYKALLGKLTGRYSHMEVRLLEVFAQLIEDGHPSDTALKTPGGLNLMYWYLLKDGIITTVKIDGIRAFIGGMPLQEAYQLTPKGVRVVQKWFAAEDIDDN